MLIVMQYNNFNIIKGIQVPGYLSEIKRYRITGKTRYAIYAIFVLLFQVLGSAYSQKVDNSYRFDHITPKDGLPHRLVFSNISG